MYQKRQRKEDNGQGAVDIGWADPVGAQRKKKRKLYQLKAKEVEDIVSAPPRRRAAGGHSLSVRDKQIFGQPSR